MSDGKRQGGHSGPTAEEIGEAVDLWERQPKESEEAFAAFSAYRDQEPPRSLRAVCKEIGKGFAIVSRWSSDNSWVARVAAWDREKDRVKREADLRGRTEMGQRHAKEASELQKVLLMPAREIIRRWQKRMEADPDGDPFKDVGDLDLIKEATKAARVYAQVGVFERLSRGLSTTNVGGHEGGAIEHDHRHRVESMPRNELEEYLLGIGQAAKAVAEKHGLPSPPVMAGDN